MQLYSMYSPALQHLHSMIPPHTSIWRTTSYQYDLGLTCLGGECTAENFIGHCWAGGRGGEGGFGEVREGCGEHGCLLCVLLSMYGGDANEIDAMQ